MSNDVVKKAVKGFRYTLFSQIVVLLLSVIKSLVLPKLLSVDDYGYWQVYVFYSAYVGLFALGYNDGIYLKYGKYQYEELPINTLRSSNRFYVLLLILFAVVASILSIGVEDRIRSIALLGVSTDILFMGINGLLIYILQITNQMKAYSFYSILDKIVLLAAIVIIGVSDNKNAVWVVIADVLSKVVVTLLLVCRFRGLFFGECKSTREGWREFIDDIKIGINLMIANLMGMFVTGIGRFIVDTFGDITDYAYYSFGITITNLVLVFITAVSLVLYPTLKRLPEANYANYYNKLNLMVTLFDFFALFAYFPAVVFIKYFLPDYVSILTYLHFLFGVIVLQAKMQLLNNTFYKVLREEKALMKSNMFCVLLFLTIALVSYSLTHSVAAIAISTFVAMLYRCYMSEIFIRKKLGVSIIKSMFWEISYIIAYVLVLSFVDYIPALIVYTVMFIVFFGYSMSDIKRISSNLE